MEQDGFDVRSRAHVVDSLVDVPQWICADLGLQPEIAAELSFSLITVGTHIRSIYAKLSVGNRSAAVRRAQELRIPGGGRTR
jgi:hypothetical protein